jgi:asparagine synthase (glutamine-hydrolysing)
MCGIIVVVGDTEEDSPVDHLTDRLAHRGPDGRGLHRVDGAVLGHCRLAIIDPAHGRQPIVERSDDPETAAALVANGMIYNYRELRSRLVASDFQSGSDSEAILRWCLDRGGEGVEDLDGMFAFVMIEEGRLIAARDPIGIKPLYVGATRVEGGRRLMFASELKALWGVADEIEVFPPGSILNERIEDLVEGEGSLRDLAYRRYYRTPAFAGGGGGRVGEHGLAARAPIEEGRARSLAAGLRATIERAVEKRLQSDVPLGCFLSGGLDSSIIAGLARGRIAPLHTFSVGVEGSEDLEAARRMSAHLGTVHHELVITPEMVREALPKIIYHLETFDQDLVRSAVPCWFVSELARRHVTVVLTGEGADELFAGYAYHREYGQPEALATELARSINVMHGINLQRVDRMTMAHGLEARVPFLDREVIEHAAAIDMDLKLKEMDRRLVEKWILRLAFEDLLPGEIVWRVKQQFDQGSGLDRLLDGMVPDGESSGAEVLLPDGRTARGPEEAWYARMLGEQFGEDPRVFRLAARWADSRVA